MRTSTTNQSIAPAVKNWLPVKLFGTKAIGLDWGASHYFSTIDQDGDFKKVENPRYPRNSKELLSSLQCDLVLTKKGRRTHRNLKRRIAKLHQKIARQRLDFTHKETAKLVEVAALIATEKLAIKKSGFHDKGQNSLCQAVLMMVAWF